MDLGGQADFTLVGNAPEHARQGINNFIAAVGPGVLPPGFPSGELIGLCALLLSYIQRGQVGQIFAKQIAPLMARTDFASVPECGRCTSLQQHVGSNSRRGAWNRRYG